MQARTSLVIVCRLFVTLALLLTVSGHLLAQTETGRVLGRVIDQSGAVVPGATVTLTSTTAGTMRTTVSDATGNFIIANVQPGPYQLKVELREFNVQTTNVTVTVGASIAVESRLQVSGTAEAVHVTAEAPIVNTVNPEVSVTVNQDQIRELPTLTRNPYDLVALAGNVADNSREAVDNGANRGTGYNINGLRASSTNVLLDGAANNNEFDATVGQAVPLDSVQEFSVITSSFSAQYGRATGGIVNVATKSGTNLFRGTAYEFYRSDALANNTVDNVANGIEKGKFSRHQLGYSLGGPIIKDTLHFFSSLEDIRVRSSDTQISWVPTAQFIAASNSATQAFFAKYGTGVSPTGTVLTRSQVSALIGSGAGAFSLLDPDMPIFAQVRKSMPKDAGGGDPQDDYLWMNRVDYALSPRTQMFIRYAYESQQSQPGTQSASPYNGYDTNYVKKNHNLAGTVTHVIGSTLTLQTKLVWNRLFQEQPVNTAAQPRLMMNPSGPVKLGSYRIAFPGYLPWSPANDIPFGGPQQLIQFYQDQTWMKGHHDFRFGGSYVHIADDRTFAAYNNAVESLNATSSALVSLDNFVAGRILQFQAAINPAGYPGQTYVTPVAAPSFTSDNRYNEFAVYASDDWSLRHNVKLNLGVRYEYYGPQQKSEPKYDSNFYYADPNVSVNWSTPQQIIASLQNGRVAPSNQSPIGQLWKSDWNNFAPRAGIAWDVNGDGRTSIRGGYGMAYERNFGNVTFNVLFNPPLYLVATINAPTDVATMPIYVDDLGPFGGVAGVTKTIPAGSLRHVDQNIVTAYAHFWSAAYQQEIGPDMSGQIEYTASAGRSLYDLADINRRGNTLVHTGKGGATERPTSLYTGFNTRGNRGRSDYDGVTFSFDARRVAGTGIRFGARYTLSQAEDNLSSTFSDGNNGYFNLGYLDPFDPNLDWGYSEYDVRHRLTFSGIWNIPFLEDAGGMKEAMLGGWQITGIFTARSGYPFSVFDCQNGLSVCMRALDPTNVNKTAGSGTPTGSPNEYTLLDLTPLMKTMGSYVNPQTGNSDFGPWPITMTARDAFRGPGYWNVDMMFGKRFRFGGTKAFQFRLEMYNVFNHANMYVNSGNADISSFDTITGYKDGNRRMQLGFKFEF